MSQKPVNTIRLGRVKAVIWTNQTEKGPRSSVQIARLYRDGEEWKETHSFNRDDLLLVAKVADLAHSWIHACENETSAQ
jgi:hypothetical protein